MLKQLIQRLLDSRTTPAQAAHSAMPSNNYTRLVENGTIGSEWTAQAFSGVAAFDGYLYLAGTSTSSVPIIGISSAGVTGNLTFPWEGARLATSIPIAKGQTWTVQGSNLKDVIIDLTKTIGGGYIRSIVSAVCKRGELCRLKALSLFSPRSSFRTNPNGSAIKLCQTIQPSGLFTHLKAHPVNTSHRLTGMSLFTPVAMNGRKSGMETEVSSSPQRVLPTNAFKCLSLKAPKFGMSFRTPWPTELKKRPLSLFQQSERDALTGGALC